METEMPAKLSLNEKFYMSLRVRNHTWTKRLLEEGADPNFVLPSDTRTPLHIAVDYNDIKMAQILVEGGCNPLLVDYCFEQMPYDYATGGDSGALKLSWELYLLLLNVTSAAINQSQQDQATQQIETRS